jgi:hypothetical protein
VNSAFHFISQALAFDERSLKVFRVALAMIVLFIIAQRFSYIDNFYASSGFYHQANLWHRPWFLSPFNYFNDTLSIKIIFVIAAFLVLIWMMGFYPMLTGLLVFYFLNAIELRAPFLMNGGDILILILVFFSCLFPQVKDGFSHPQKLFTGSFVVYYFQVFYIYFSSITFKLSTQVWPKGEGLKFALMRKNYATDFGDYFSQLPDGPLIVFSYLVLLLQILGPLLLPFTYRFWRCRLALCGSLMLFHLLTGLIFHIGHFHVTSMVMWIPFIPSQVWNKLSISKELEFKILRDTMNKIKVFILCFFIFISIGMSAIDLFKLDYPDSPWVKIYPLGRVLRLHQSWDAFASKLDLRLSTYNKIRVSIKEGNVIDGINGYGAYQSFEKPRPKTYLARKILLNVPSTCHSKELLPLAEMPKELHYHYAMFLCEELQKQDVSAQRVEYMTVFPLSDPPEEKICLSYDCPQIGE